MIPHFGWRSVLMLGGIGPLVLGALMLVLLPESVRYMVARGQPAEQIRRVLGRISPTASQAQTFTMTETARPTRATSGIGLVLSRSYVVGSVMLWLTYFMGLVIFYALINWMPLLFKDAGVDAQTATLIAALFPLGGCGAILSGWVMDRFNANITIAVCYALTAIFVYAVGQAVGSIGMLMLLVFLAGTLMNTAQSSMPALAAAFYPTQGRATGVAWMLGIGRLGGIVGSFLIAELARWNLSFAQVFMVVAIPGLVAALALLVKQFAHPESRRAAVPAGGEALVH
jgi:AAHS family 4-hydroxybenzoate transporter-like MFS transporter